MDLNQLIDPLILKEVSNERQLFITGIAYDSRKVEKGNLFICLSGYTVDGHDFIPQAITNGAAALLVEKEVHVPSHIPVITVPDARRAMAFIADRFYGSPTETLRAIGVTGTNGKTTTTSIIQHILNDNEKKSGRIGTIDIQYDDTVITSKNTTPDSLELQATFQNMLDAGMSHVVMEVSSHALSLGRVRGAMFRTAVFTNLSQDHLDYHQTMDHYRESKGLLFSQLGNDFGEGRTAVLNNDDAAASVYKERTPAQVVTYGIRQEADVRASDIRLTPKGTTFRLQTFRGDAVVETKLIGEFNVYNLLAAITACLVEGIALEDIVSSIRDLDGVPGRFETVDAGQPFAVIVDYAHTPDSLENVLQTARQFSKGSITTVVGCGGDRDSSKRPLMARVAETYSDYVVLTSDNPRSEDPNRILSDMEAGMANETYVKIPDRENGIAHAVERHMKHASPDDCIIIAGKGHETYQLIGGETKHFDDREVARKHISLLNGSASLKIATNFSPDE